MEFNCEAAVVKWFLVDVLYTLCFFPQNVHLLPNGDLLIYRHDNYSHTYTCLTEFQSSNGSWVNVTLSQHTLHTHTTLTPSTSVQLANHRAVLHSGENSTLICTYSRLQRSCDLTATPRWSHNGREINSTEPLYSGHVLQLEEVGVVNSGKYCCEVEGEESCTTIHVIETSELILKNLVSSHYLVILNSTPS